MDITFNTNSFYHRIEARLSLEVTGLIDKLVAAVNRGSLRSNGYYGDIAVEGDDDIVWVDIDLSESNRWLEVGVVERAEGSTLVLSAYVDQDNLDGTAPLNYDAEQHWMDFISPLKKLLAVLN